MKKLKKSPMSHNVCYAETETEELFPVYYTCNNGQVRKSFSLTKPVPSYFLSFTSLRLVDKYVIRTDVSKIDVMVYEVSDCYFYRLVDSSFSSNSIGFISLDDCLQALRIYASDINGVLRIMI